MDQPRSSSRELLVGRASRHEALAGFESSKPRGAIQLTAMTTTTGYHFKHRKPRATRNRKGSGPYKSVLKERAVAFNLTLDVQHLKQEIQQLETTRDLLRSRLLQQRHLPSGSLVQVVREYYRLFRQGFRVEEHPRRRRVITAGVQREFLFSVIDEDIDFGNGLGGVEFMIEQIRRYSLLLRFICLKMDSFEIVLLEDRTVMIKATGSIRFQILRETILGLFPHIISNASLCSRLIGAEVEAPNLVSFYFDSQSRVTRYEFDVDYVKCFSDVLGNLEDVLELLGQSRIGDKSMFGVTPDGHVEEVVLYEERDDERQVLGHTENTTVGLPRRRDEILTPARRGKELFLDVDDFQDPGIEYDVYL